MVSIRLLVTGALSFVTVLFVTALFVTVLPGLARPVVAEIVSRTTLEVEDAIRGVPDLGPHDIDIETHRGFVHLKGTVSSPSDIERVEAAVRETRGVTSVKNELVAHRLPMAGSTGPSRKLAAAIRARIGADHSLGHYDLEILVTGSTAALVGSVLNPEDSTAIERIARGTPGVATVDNRLTIASPTSDAAVELNVREALQKAGDVDLAGLDISANEGVVTFAGARPGHRDIDRILGVALMVEGVRDIKSEMTIEPGAHRVGTATK